MEERLKRLYRKEEEFLDEFGEAATVAVRLLNGEWDPNYTANDVVRKNLEYFFSAGEVSNLVFDSASVYHDDNSFSSVQIILKSSRRLVNVRVRKVHDELVGEKIVDRPIDAQGRQL
jgi:hypothetical protein